MLKNVEMKYADTWSRVLSTTTQLRHSCLVLEVPDLWIILILQIAVENMLQVGCLSMKN